MPDADATRKLHMLLGSLLSVIAEDLNTIEDAQRKSVSPSYKGVMGQWQRSLTLIRDLVVEARSLL